VPQSLADLVAIPSISSQPEHADDVRRSAHFPAPAAPYVLGMVKGQYEGRSIWAFTSARSDTESVVMKLKQGWPGELTVTRTDAAAAKTRAAAHSQVGKTKLTTVQADGCDVIGDITDGGFAEVAKLLSGAEFLAVVTVADLPAGVTFGAWFDDDHIGVQVAWAADPDEVMPVALALLSQLAGVLEADASTRGAMPPARRCGAK